MKAQDAKTLQQIKDEMDKEIVVFHRKKAQVEAYNKQVDEEHQEQRMKIRDLVLQQRKEERILQT